MSYKGTPFTRGTYYSRLKRAKALGCSIYDVPDRRGKHGNHAKGEKNGKWNGGKMLSSHGYVLVRVSKDHPHAIVFGDQGYYGYCYEHIFVMTEHLGRPLKDGEIVHHKDGNKENNDLSNLDLLEKSIHAKHHNKTRPRDSFGRYAG